MERRHGIMESADTPHSTGSRGDTAALSCARAAAKQMDELDRAIAIGLREVRLGRGNTRETGESVLQLTAQRNILRRTLQRGRFTRYILESGPPEAREILDRATASRSLSPADERTLEAITISLETPENRRRRLELEVVDADLRRVQAQLKTECAAERRGR